MIDHADILEWAARYEGPLFHALLTDPPYHLTTITDRFGKPGAAPAQFGNDGVFQRAARGFMNSTWDGGDIAFRPETWAALGRLLHPGAFIMAFAGTRGYHRMATAIEDAGFILHPVICWNFSTGFPKATRIDTQLDRAAGVTPTVIGTRKQTGAKFTLTQELIDNGGFNDPDRDDYDVTTPATPLAQAWQGHRYGGQVLKPAIELICVAQKPYQGRPVDSITRTGAGAINVDGGRIEGTPKGWAEPRGGICPPDTAALSELVDNPNGRWPSNLVLSHSPDCNGECIPSCPVRRLGEQSGESESSPHNGAEYRNRAMDFHMTGGTTSHDDSGTAARLFFNSDYALERLEAADPLMYFPKASTTEREAGLDLRTMAGNDDSRVVSYGGNYTVNRCPEHGESIPSGSIQYRCGCPILRGREYFPESTINDGRKKSIDNAYQRGETTRRNTHPTIKPISLARHLATLLLPPDLYAPRRLLVPFAGAGSEMIGAMLAGWEHVQGVELEADHVAIARARIAYWQQLKYKLMNPDTPVKVTISRAPQGQRDMFEEED